MLSAVSAAKSRVPLAGELYSVQGFASRRPACVTTSNLSCEPAFGGLYLLSLDVFFYAGRGLHQ